VGELAYDWPPRAVLMPRALKFKPLPLLGRADEVIE